jgi:CubicO group peptidase (beta-lactamase class C family)
MGIAHEEGAIPDLLQPMDFYAPDLKGSGYEGVPVEDVLEMSAPIAFNEDYANPFSDINRLGYALALKSPIDRYMQSLKRQEGNRKGFHYISPNTQALAMVIRAATGRDFTSYFQEKLWSQLGTESDAFWIQDNRGVELVFGGLNATLRDYGRLGLLYLHRGTWNGQRIVDEEWIDRSVRPGKPYLLPRNSPSPSSWGYGYHWWIPYATDGDYSAIGIYHQYIYVNPKLKVVIVKTSADPQYNANGAYKELETMAMFRAMARGLDSQRSILSRSP